MDHILPKKVAFILNVIDTPLNYSPTHTECNGHKSENLPTFNDIPMNSRYLGVLKGLVKESANYNALANRDRKKYTRLHNAFLGREQFNKAAEEFSFDQNVTAEDMQKLALLPREPSSAPAPGRRARGAPASAAAAARAARAARTARAARAPRVTRANPMDMQEGGAPTVSLAPGFLNRPTAVVPARASSAVPHVPRRTVSGVIAQAPVVGQARSSAILPKAASKAAPVAPAAIYAAALPREPAFAASRKIPSPARVAAALGKVLTTILKNPIVSVSYVLYVTLLATVVDFYDYVAQDEIARKYTNGTRGARGRSQSGGNPRISSEENKYFTSFKKYKTGAEIMEVQQRCDFLRFRYRMMYNFSVATYYESAHAEYILRGEATDANPAYARYIMQRLDNCLVYFMEFNRRPELLQ